MLGKVIAANLSPNLCPCCKKEHPVEYKQVRAKSLYMDVTIEHDETYRYCSSTDGYYLSDAEIKANHDNKYEAYKRLQAETDSNPSALPIGAIRYPMRIGMRDM